MAKTPPEATSAPKTPEGTPEPLKYQTWVLKVYIHCEGCKKKVKKVLQGIEGVYMTTIDSQQQKATVTGNVDAQTLIKKLLKTGKHAELWPEKSVKKPGKSKNNDKEAKNDGKLGGGGDQKNSVAKSENPSKNGESEEANQIEEGEKESKEETDEEIGEGEGATGQSGGGNGGKKKKKKKKKSKGQNANSNNGGENSGDAPNGTLMETPNRGLTTPMMSDNLNSLNQHVYPYPPMYYPPPVYGVSYNMAYPSSSGSYYAPTMHSHPEGYPPAPPSEPIVAADYDYDDENVGCSIM